MGCASSEPYRDLAQNCIKSGIERLNELFKNSPEIVKSVRYLRSPRVHSKLIEMLSKFDALQICNIQCENKKEIIYITAIIVSKNENLFKFNLFPCEECVCIGVQAHAVPL